MRPSELASRLQAIHAQGLFRQCRRLDWRRTVEVEHEGRRLLNFASNDYLGLADHPLVVESFRKAATRWGVGSGASHLICGHTLPHHALEEELAAFIGRERVLLFSTGYMANLGVISALAERGTWVFEDRLNHASLLDGARLAGARLKRYRHGATDSLAEALSDCPGTGQLVVSDGVFSMDGDLAPLPELVRLTRAVDAWLMVDDAHGLGVLGKDGRGVLEVFGLDQDDVPILVGTLGKAFGTFGAFVAGRRELIDYLLQRARTYAYTTALPPAIAEATRTSLCLLTQEAWRRDRLHALVAHFRQGAQHLGLRLLASDTPIQPIVIGDNKSTLLAHRLLLEAGFLVGAVRPPTVPVGSARLRVTLSAAHEAEHIDRLLEALARLPTTCT